MHYSACDHCNRLFVIRHRPSPLRPCPNCRRGLRIANRDELVDRFQATVPSVTALSPAIFKATARASRAKLDHPADW